MPFMQVNQKTDTPLKNWLKTLLLRCIIYTQLNIQDGDFCKSSKEFIYSC